MKSLLKRRIKPWLIAVADLHNIMPEEPTFIADYVFMDEALKLGKPLMSLDDYQQKQSRIGSLDLNQQFEYLEQLLDLRALDNDRHFRNIIHAFESGNINQIYKLFEAFILPEGVESRWRTEWAQELWEYRNHAWIETLMPFVGQSANFVVVGATHLGGDHGLIRLFEQKGFDVRPIEMNNRK